MSSPEPYVIPLPLSIRFWRLVVDQWGEKVLAYDQGSEVLFLGDDAEGVDQFVPDVTLPAVEVGVFADGNEIPVRRVPVGLWKGILLDAIRESGHDVLVINNVTKETKRK